MSYSAWILLTASLVGMCCGLVGVLLILRRMAMMADAISHSVLLGIVVAYLVTLQLSGIHMFIGAIIAGLVTALLVQSFHQLGVQQEASIGIVFTTLFAIGVILISTKAGNAHLDIQHSLMGEITFIPWNTVELPFVGSVPMAVVSLSIVLLIVLLVLLLFYKEWKLTSFDPVFAASIGIPVTLMHYIFMSLVSITSVAAFDAVGAIMVVAMLITPASAAYLWTDKLPTMLVLSCSFGVAAAWIGYYVAVWLDTSISGAMAFATGIIFLISFIAAPRYGIIAKHRRSRASAALTEHA